MGQGRWGFGQGRSSLAKELSSTMCHPRARAWKEAPFCLHIPSPRGHDGSQTVSHPQAGPALPRRPFHSKGLGSRGGGIQRLPLLFQRPPELLNCSSEEQQQQRAGREGCSYLESCLPPRSWRRAPSSLRGCNPFKHKGTASRNHAEQPRCRDGRHNAVHPSAAADHRGVFSARFHIIGLRNVLSHFISYLYDSSISTLGQSVIFIHLFLKRLMATNSDAGGRV